MRIRKSRQKGQPEHIKQELQVGLTDGNQIGSLFAQMSVGGKGDFGSSESSFQGIAFHVPVAQFEVEHGTERISFVCREGSGIEVHFPYQVGIKDTYRTARCSLCAEMVDIRDLYSVQVKAVFGRRSAAYDQVVTVSYR